MKSNYKRLGDFIQPVDVRNIEDKRYDLLGVSVEKRFIPSIANTVGTDWHSYKIIKKGQFCYIPDTSRRGEKIGIALLTDKEIGLVSAVYMVFEVVSNQLIPEYLMLWFKRAEFDRYARYHSHGSVREIFDWEEMCNVELPVPSIEEQKAIVNAYETIERRIELKRKINDNLESQLTATFHALFDEQNGWGNGCISDLGEIIGGATPSKEIDEYFCAEGIAWLTPKDLTSYGRKFIYRGEIDITNDAYHSCSTKIMPKGTVLLTSRAPVGCVAIAMTNLCTNQGFKSIVPKEDIGTEYIYYFLKENKQLLESYSSGTTFMEIAGNVLKSIPTLLPPQALTHKFTRICEPIFNTQKQIEREIDDLNTLQDTLISQLSSR